MTEVTRLQYNCGCATRSAPVIIVVYFVTITPIQCLLAHVQDIRHWLGVAVPCLLYVNASWLLMPITDCGHATPSHVLCGEHKLVYVTGRTLSPVVRCATCCQRRCVRLDFITSALDVRRKHIRFAESARRLAFVGVVAKFSQLLSYLTVKCYSRVPPGTSATLSFPLSLPLPKASRSHRGRRGHMLDDIISVFVTTCRALSDSELSLFAARVARQDALREIGFLIVTKCIIRLIYFIHAALLSSIRTQLQSQITTLNGCSESQAQPESAGRWFICAPHRAYTKKIFN